MELNFPQLHKLPARWGWRHSEAPHFFYIKLKLRNFKVTTNASFAAKMKRHFVKLFAFMHFLPGQRNSYIPVDMQLHFVSSLCCDLMNRGCQSTQVFHTSRINLSPFTKDFRVWVTPIEIITISCRVLNWT